MIKYAKWWKEMKQIKRLAIAENLFSWMIKIMELQWKMKDAKA